MTGRATKYASTAAKFAAVLVAGASMFGQPACAADMEAMRKKAETCFACHGPDGNSTDPAVPSLAGQPKQFITTQLVMFHEGNRKNPPMFLLTSNMSNADMNEYGTFFTAQKRVTKGQPVSEEKIAAGKRVTEQYNCVQCHGPALLGQQHIPGLAGQQPEYLRTQLKGFKAMTRFDMDGNMTSAAQPLTPADIDMLAEYLSSLQ